MPDPIEEAIRNAGEGRYEQVQLTGRMLRTDVTVSDELMDDRQFVLRASKDQMYRDIRLSLTTTVWGRDIGTYVYYLPKRTRDYLLIWLRDTLGAYRNTEWLVGKLPEIQMRKITIDAREEFPSYHQMTQIGPQVIAFYRRSEDE